MDSAIVVHISDLHVRSADSSALVKMRALPSAVGSIRDGASHVLILLSGDVAFSGKASEYSAFAVELSAAIHSLKEVWGFSEAFFAVCPGNHDCNFGVQSDPIRTALLQGLAAAQGAPELVDSLCEVQSDFEDFRNEFSSEFRSIGRLVSVSEFDLGCLNVNVISVNTSWSSRLAEVPGSLRMPAPVLPSISMSDDLSIAILHHPLNWYDPQDGKSLSDWLDVSTDLALWGHEHREDLFKVVRRRYGSSVTHFLGKPMEDDSVECGFRCIRLETEGHSEDVVFRWRGDIFEVERREVIDLKKNPARQLGKIRFNQGFKDFLSDPGGAFKHPRLERSLLMQDIFVEPSFREFSSSPSDLDKADLSTPMLDVVNQISRHSASAVFGSEQSGKTTFAKYLIEDARHNGQVPLYFDGGKLKSANKGEVTAWIRTSISFQYEDDCLDLVQQVIPRDKVILIDNVHEIPGSASAVAAIMGRLKELGGRVIYFSAQNPAVTILAASHSSGEEVKLWSDAKWFEMLPLNNKARGRIIRRWVSVGRDEFVDGDLIEAEARRIKLALDDVFGSGFGLKYPFFLLALLQQIDAGNDAKTIARNGSQGHIFEAMVTSALEANVRSHDLSVTHDFLSQVAFQLWSAETSQISESGIEELISNFRRDKLVQLSHPSLMNEVISSKIFQKSGDGVIFRYPYFYYYYLARWISGGKGNAESESLLKEFVEKIHAESAANIVTFVAHLGHQDWVLGLLIPSAKSLFENASECRLSEQAPLASKYLAHDKSAVMITGSAVDVSDHVNDHLDKANFVPADDLEDAFQYMTAVRTIQVLGQIMRSRAGSIDAPMKKSVANVATSLARRLMTVMYAAAEQSAEVIIEHASELFDSDIESNSAEAVGMANRLIAAVIGGVAKGLVTRAAEVTAAPEFIPLIEELEREARQKGDLDNELVALCSRIVALQRYPKERVEALLKSVPASDILSRSALAHSVARVFYLAPPERSIRDSACARLGIKVKALPPKLLN